MQDPFDAHRHDGGAHQRRQENTSERIADGLAEAVLERLRVKFAVRRG